MNTQNQNEYSSEMLTHNLNTNNDNKTTLTKTTLTKRNDDTNKRQRKEISLID